MADDINQNLEQRYSSASEVQTISTTDAISEGPIFGLVDGVSSIFLNDIRQTETKYGQKQYSRTGASATVINGGTTATITLFDDTLKMHPDLESPRYFVFRDFIGTPCVTYEIKDYSNNQRKSSYWYLKDPNNATNWWPASHLSVGAITTGRYSNRRPGEYYPVRVVEVSTGRVQTGKIFENKGSTVTVEFSPSIFDGSSWLGDSDAYGEWIGATNLLLFTDIVSEVTAIDLSSSNSDGSSTYTLTLKDAWSGNYVKTFNAYSEVANNTITFASAHNFNTGDKVIYTTVAPVNQRLGGLTLDTVHYFVIKTSDTAIKLASSREGAFSGTSLNLTPPTGASTNHDIQSIEKDFDDMGYDFSEAEEVDGLTESGEVQSTTGVQVQFRVGQLDQTPLRGEGGVGSSAVTNTVNAQIAQTNASNYEGDQAPLVFQGVSGSGFNLSATQAEVADEVRLRWSYPGGFKAIDSKGDDKKTFIRYKLSLATKDFGASVFNNPAYAVEIIHEGIYNNSVGFEETIDLTPFRPFSDFQVTIERRDSDDDPGFYAVGQTSGDWTNVTRGQIASLTTIFKEKMIYPLTSVAKVSFSSKSFQNVPKRSYHCRGMLIKVPSNYVTREESGGAAKYTRKGDYDTDIPQDWDGTFRDFVYTNNPAWIFYDLITNNRYGLGDFIKETDIDKYALYRIGKYCDEEVSDGKGGTEPRYTLNAYLMKSTDAYKVMKDLLSNFVTIMYYLNGQIFPVQDSPSGPIYNFSKANVIDGAFSYESTGSKTILNQVIVEWNNPENNYELEPLIVEDRRAIAESGVIISQRAVAYGCTSEGQATRYGKWKLWTSNNQQEVVSFATGINGSYITPGDIILVQDADRNAVRYSGRISTGTMHTYRIPLDSPVTIDANNDYELSVIIQKPAAFLAQDSATINGDSFVKGDLITQAFVDVGGGTYQLQNIDSSEKASDAKSSATSTEKLLLNFKDDFRVETKPVDKGQTGTGSQDVIILSSGLSAVPLREDIWVLTEKNSSGVLIAGSGKEYKVLSTVQDDQNHYEISAVEHYDDKFSAVEGAFTTYTAKAIARTFKTTDIVPPPEDVWVSVILTPTEEHENVRVYYTPAASPFVDVTKDDGTITQASKQLYYEGSPYVEITHNIPDPQNPSPMLVAQREGSPSVTFKSIPPGKYEVHVRTVGPNGVKSLAVRRNFTVNSRFRNRIAGYFPEAAHAGGSSNRGIEIEVT